jgi:hypothetical protein
MAKTTTLATMSPLEFTAGVPVYYEDAKAVLEMLNWAFSYRPETHFSLCTADANYGGASELQTLEVLFPNSSGWNHRLIAKIEVQADVQEIKVGARCWMDTGQEGQVRFTVGAAAATTLTTFTNSTNGTEHTATIATSSTGTGAIDVIIEINHTVGTGATSYLRDVRCENVRVAAANLADPPDA